MKMWVKNAEYITLGLKRLFQENNKLLMNLIT